MPPSLHIISWPNSKLSIEANFTLNLKNNSNAQTDK